MSNLENLLADWRSGRLTRRQFLAMASALGLSASAARIVSSESGVLAAQPGDQPGPATDTLTFSSFNVDQAPLNIENGDMDLYLFGLKTAGAQSLEDADDIDLISAPASTLSLILNPAPAMEGALNPFSIPEIRYAMQFLVDREFIANDIYQGRALPMLTNISSLDYDQLTIFPVISEANITYQAEYAGQQITDAMNKAGATMDSGSWTFDGKPVMIKIITRVEDERRDIGDLIRAALEKLGFQVQPVYQPFGPATLAVYASDPQTFQWHIYTEGWGRGAPVRYDDAGINNFAAPWLGNMPGWQEVGFWQYQNDQLDDMGKKLYRGEFSSQDERNKLYQDMASLALTESVRVWLVTALQSFPVRTDVKNLQLDIVSGPKNTFSLRSANIQDKSQIRAGNLWVWTERTTWNPIGGFSDVYSSDIYKNMIDPPLVNHPYTGLPVSFRADFTVDTAGPDGTMDVPDGAVLWDAANDAWAPVESGTTAKSKVSFDYSKFLQTTWQHGQPITMADVIYPIAQSFELAFDQDKVQIETALGITSRPLLESFKAYVFGDSTVDVYVDYWHFDDGYIASYASSTSVSTPWEVLAAMDDVVFDKRQGAYTDTTAARFSVPWISLVTESDARLVLRSIRQFSREQTIPAGYFDVNGTSYLTSDEATARYDACDAWFKDKNLLVIANGPYELTSYDPPAQFAQLDAFRPDNYPFTSENYRFGDIPTISIDPIGSQSVNLGDAISVQVKVSGSGDLAMQYTFVDPAAGSVLETGDATANDDGTFGVDIDPAVTATLFPGLYNLFLIGSSSDIAQVAQQQVDIEVGV